MKNFLTGLFVVLMLMVTLAGCANGTKTKEATQLKQVRKNVVLIHVDDLGWRDLGCMGSQSTICERNEVIIKVITRIGLIFSKREMGIISFQLRTTS